MEYDNYEPGFLGIIILTIMGLLQFFSGKAAGRQEVIDQVRDAEIADLRHKIEEFQRSRH